MSTPKFEGKKKHFTQKNHFYSGYVDRGTKPTIENPKAETDNLSKNEETVESKNEEVPEKEN